MGQSSQDKIGAVHEDDPRAPATRHVAPGVYLASDGMLTADCLDSAIAYLRELGERGAESLACER